MQCVLSSSLLCQTRFPLYTAGMLLTACSRAHTPSLGKSFIESKWEQQRSNLQQAEGLEITDTVPVIQANSGSDPKRVTQSHMSLSLKCSHLCQTLSCSPSSEQALQQSMGVPRVHLIAQLIPAPAALSTLDLRYVCKRRYTLGCSASLQKTICLPKPLAPKLCGTIWISWKTQLFCKGCQSRGGM